MNQAFISLGILVDRVIESCNDQPSHHTRETLLEQLKGNFQQIIAKLIPKTIVKNHQKTT